MAKRRDPWLDNAKTLLIVIVVVGHAIVLMPGGDLKSHVYDFIYYFHIPAFVLITGYLSRTFQYTRKHLVALVTTLLVPYLIFELLMALWRVYVVDQVSSLDVLSPLWLNPHWPMWYLAAVIIWRLATPVLRSHWLMIPIAVALSLVAGNFNMETFDLNRALGFLPFFVVGLHLPKVALFVVKARVSGLFGVAVLAWLWWFSSRTDDHWSTPWLYYRSSYETLGASFSEGVEIRAQLIAIGLLATFAALTLVPRRATAVTSVGTYTLGVYLLHGFVIRWVEAQGYEDWMPGNGWTSLVITVAFGVALALLLGWKPLATKLLWLVDPINTFTRWRATRRRRGSVPTSG